VLLCATISMYLAESGDSGISRYRWVGRIYLRVVSRSAPASVKRLYALYV
jgi:hypothetical protein